MPTDDEHPQGMAHEQRGIAPEHSKQKAERRWYVEMRDQLAASRPESRQPTQSLDINVRAYEVICSLAKRTWGKILPEVIANREALHPAGRRVLLKTLRARVKRQRELAAQAEQRAQQLETFIEQLDDSKHV